MTYPAHIVCPACGHNAANLTVGLSEIILKLIEDQTKLDRFLLRTDAGKPGPSNHLVVCQHCHYPFRANPKLIIEHV